MILYDLYDLYGVAHAAGWESYNVHGLGHVSWVGSVLCRPFTTAGEELDDLPVGHDLSEMRKVANAGQGV